MLIGGSGKTGKPTERVCMMDACSICNPHYVDDFLKKRKKPEPPNSRRYSNARLLPLLWFERDKENGEYTHEVNCPVLVAKDLLTET